MQEYTTISVKIPVKEREELRRLKIKPSKVLREAIMEQLRLGRIKRLMDERDKMDEIFKKLPSEFVTASIREDRDSR